MNNTPSYLAFELRRLMRDSRTLLALLVVFAVPVAAKFAGFGVFGGSAMSLLLVPVAVAWNWGRDLAEGPLVPIALSGRRPLVLLASRAAVLLLPLCIWLAFVSVLGRLEPAQIVLLGAFALHMLMLGFFLANLLRGTEAGWLPIVFLVVGVWAPMMSDLRAANGSAYSAWVRWSASLLAPVAALNLGFQSALSLAAISALSAAAWTSLCAVQLQRPGVLDGRR